MAEIAAAQLRAYPPRGEFPATPVVTSMSVLDTQETQKVEKKIYRDDAGRNGVGGR